MPTENLQALIDELSPSLKELRGTFEGDQLVHRGVEANVSQTADEVLDRSPMLRRLVAQGELELIQAVYDLDTGVVRVLSGPERAAARARL
jgi:carbonic anhydrase